MLKYLIFFILFFSLNANAQLVQVLDKETSEALSYASLSACDGQISRICNYKGQVDITIFQTCDSVLISMLGYEDLHVAYTFLDQQSYVYLQKHSVALNTLVVSSVRRPVTADKVPVRIKNISANDVSFHVPQTSADLLTLSGEVFMQKSQQGGGSPMIRGFAANRLLYTVDGVRMNTAIFRSGNLQNVISLDAYAMEDVEVLFGAGSVVYGSDAIGGVMAFRTKSPILQSEAYFKGQLDAAYASANHSANGHADFAYGSTKFSGLSSFSYYNYGDLKMGKNGPDDYLQKYLVVRENGQDVEVENEDPLLQTPAGYNQFNLMQKFRFKLSDNWDLQYAFHYSEISDYSRYDRLLRRKNDQPRYGEWHYGPQIWMMNHLDIAYNAQHRFFESLNIKLSHQHFGESRISRDFNAINREIREEEVEAFSLNIDFDKKLNQHHLFYGAEGVRNDVNSVGKNQNIIDDTQQAGPSRYPQALWASYALYAYDQFDLNKQSNLTMGLRYNFYHIDAKFDTSFYPFSYTTAQLHNQAVTAHFGYNYRPDKSTLLRLNFSTAFRAPNIDDMGKVFDSEPGNVVVPNPDLKAEYAYNAELGAAKVFNDFLKVEASAYYTYLNNALVRRGFQLNDQDSIFYDGEMSQVQAIQNAAFAYVYGAHLGLEMDLPYHLKLKVDYNWQKGEEEQDDGTMTPARHVAPAFLRGVLSYHYQRFRAEVNTIYTFERGFESLPESEQSKAYIYALDTNGNPYSPDWYCVNLLASYRMNDNLIVKFAVENISSQRYRPYSSGIAAQGRNFKLSLTYQL